MSWLSLSGLEPDDQEALVAILADEAEQLGDSRWLQAALAHGDLLGGRDPAHVSSSVRNRRRRSGERSWP